MEGGFVTVAQRMLPVNAEMARLNLERNGIKAVLLDETVTSIGPSFNTLVNVRIQVPASQAARAYKILNEPVADHSIPGAAAQNWSLSAGMVALLALVLGFPHTPVRLLWLWAPGGGAYAAIWYGVHRRLTRRKA